jgi:5-methyltetrahydrofolate--homocysteine methyltransferase
MTKAHQHPLEKILEDRIAIIDGAMGTTIRTYGMTETDIRGDRFADSKKDLLNNGDLFSLTQPKMVGDIHRRFLEAGADIIETNTFGATSITQSEFFVEDPREHGGRKDPAFYQKIIEDPVLSHGISMRHLHDSVASGPIASLTRPVANGLWQVPLDR